MHESKSNYKFIKENLEEHEEFIDFVNDFIEDERIFRASDWKKVKHELKLNELELISEYFEKSIFIRRNHHIKLDVRYFHDITKNFLNYLIMTLIKQDFNKTLDKNGFNEKLFLQKKNNEKKENNEKRNLKFISKCFEVEERKIKCPKKDLEKIHKIGNETLHFSEESTNKSYGIIKISNFNLEKMINIARNFFNIWKWILELFFDIEISEEFDENIYKDGSKSIKKLWEWDDFKEWKNKKCPFCEKGKLEIPINSEFEFGPYIKCDDKDCESILSKNLNLKKYVGICTDKKCKEIEKKDKSIKQISNLGKAGKFKKSEMHVETKCMKCDKKY